MTLAKYELIDAEKAHHPIVKMCAWLGVSRSGYYEWRERPASATAQHRAVPAGLVAEIFAGAHETYGYRRVHDTRHTCASLLAALDVHPRVAMRILRRSQISMTMDVYTQIPSPETRKALDRLNASLDTEEGDR
ncbi:hypothetical protein AB0B56_25800 [Streptosporangium canum]|uniref:hypothetical protein n=1 Tax=Streptosporangium canum TaxID=324952 RepID=UPI0034286951